MTEITSNITFENKDGKIAKCVLKIAGGKTFTVTLGNRGYEVVEGGNVTASSGSNSSSASTPGSNSTKSAAPASTKSAAPASTKSAAPASTKSAAPASTSTTSTQPSQEKEYNTQEELIKTLGSYGYTSQ